jgi:hypothetical protein
MEPSMPPKIIIAAFGGLGATARRLGVPKSTVASWKKAGKVPSWRLRDVQAAADEDGIALATPKRKKAA